MPYCETTDLLISGMEMSGGVNVSAFVQDAADQIDGAIGFRYSTPVDVSSESAVVRPAKLLLKRINVLLASARLLMRLDVSAEGNRPNQLAMSWLTEAAAAIKAIRDGEQDLPGATPADPNADNTSTGPQIFNEDSDSFVAAFYQSLKPDPTYWRHTTGDIVSWVGG